MDLYWVRSDFRINNNNALEQALKKREKKLALYIYNSEKNFITDPLKNGGYHKL